MAPCPSKFENFILKFVDKKKEKKMSKEEASVVSKARWFKGTGYKGKL